MTAVPDILSALQQLILGIHLLDGAGGVIAQEVLGHHHVAWLSHGEVRLGGNDEAERLEFRSGEQLGMIAFKDDFAQIGGAAFGRDGPQYIRHVFRPELAGGGHMVEPGIDFRGTHLAIDAGFASGRGHHFGTAKIDVRGSGAMVIVDGLGGS